MRKTLKKILPAWLAAALALTGMTSVVSAQETEADGQQTEYEEVFSQWNQDAPALQTLIEYVEDVTDESSPNYIPPVDRIATFDMDGTLCAELCPTYLEYYMLAWRILKDPNYAPDAEMLEFGRMLRDHALDKSFPDHMDLLHATHAAKAYSGMTLTEFSDFVTSLLLNDVDGFEGMTYAETFYLPMIEVVEYLQENDFKVYVCSGSDRSLCRTYIEGVMDIPYEQIIGMDVVMDATNQQGADGLDYVFTKEDNIVRTDQLIIKNLKMNKVRAIVQEIGRQPVLSFGNSGGDCSMHNYTIFNNRYRSEAFMLIADDEERDYGNTEKTRALGEEWEQDGYHVISMRDDFKTIYGENVKKTGTFHWLENLAEDRVPVEAEDAAAQAGDGDALEAAAEAAEDGEAEDVQYVMYLGTNDKDTNEPVFDQEEAKEKAKAILLDNFGGYTIDDAEGGWRDGDTVYQEYTLVIYLSDTTLDDVHAAADELIDTFHQSSILIQTNPTSTEFYSKAA